MSQRASDPKEAKTPHIDVSKLNDFEISMLIIRRDTCQFEMNNIDELLARVGEVKGYAEAEPKKWDPNRIPWAQETGAKGPYERYPAKDTKAESTDDYRNMLQDLKDHKGVLQRGGYFLWLFQDGSTVGRRKRGA